MSSGKLVNHVHGRLAAGAGWHSDRDVSPAAAHKQTTDGMQVIVALEAPEGVWTMSESAGRIKQRGAQQRHSCAP